MTDGLQWSMWGGVPPVLLLHVPASHGLTGSSTEAGASLESPPHSHTSAVRAGRELNMCWLTSSRRTSMSFASSSATQTGRQHQILPITTS